MSYSNLENSLHYSLWLIPDSNSAKPLQTTIDNLAAKYASLPFRPHITVCSQLTGSVTDLSSKLKDFAKSNQPQKLRGKVFSHRDFLYQSLFMELVKDERLQQFHNNALEVLEHTPSTDFFPHVSLAYIDPRSFNASDEVLRLDPALLQETHYSRLTLMETSGEQKDWMQLLEIDLNER